MYVILLALGAAIFWLIFGWPNGLELQSRATTFGLIVLGALAYHWLISLPSKLISEPARLDQERLAEIQELRRKLEGDGKTEEGPDLPRLRIQFDPQRHVVYPHDDKNYALVYVGIRVDGKVGVEEAGLQVAEIVAPRGKDKRVAETITRMRGREIVDEQMESAIFPVNLGPEQRIPLLGCYSGSFYFRTVGYTDDDWFPNGTYEVTLIAHGKGAKPHKCRFELKKSGGKRTRTMAVLKPKDGGGS